MKIVHVPENALRGMWLSPCVLFFAFGKPWRIRFRYGQMLNAMYECWCNRGEKQCALRNRSMLKLNWLWQKNNSIFVNDAWKNPNWKWRARSQSGQSNHKQFSCANQRPTTSISNLFSGVVVYWAHPTPSYLIWYALLLSNVDSASTLRNEMYIILASTAIDFPVSVHFYVCVDLCRTHRCLCCRRSPTLFCPDPRTGTRQPIRTNTISILIAANASHLKMSQWKSILLNIFNFIVIEDKVTIETGLCTTVTLTKLHGLRRKNLLL